MRGRRLDGGGGRLDPGVAVDAPAARRARARHRRGRGPTRGRAGGATVEPGGPGRLVEVDAALLDGDQHGERGEQLGDRRQRERPVLVAVARRRAAPSARRRPPRRGRTGQSSMPARTSRAQEPSQTMPAGRSHRPPGRARRRPGRACRCGRSARCRCRSRTAPAAAARRPARESTRDAELLVLLLADVAGAVVHGDADAPLAGAVGAAAVPEAAVPHEHAARRHLGGDRVVRRRRSSGEWSAQVRAGDDPGGAVRLGEVGERPHRVADRRRVRLRERDELVVGVDRLRASRPGRWRSTTATRPGSRGRARPRRPAARAGAPGPARTRGRGRAGCRCARCGGPRSRSSAGTARRARARAARGSAASASTRSGSIASWTIV